MFGGRKSQPVQTSQPSSEQNNSATPTPSASTRPPVGFETVLGANSTFKGELTSKTNVRLDGNFDGSVEVEGTVLVGETARIVANITARHEVKIAGAVRGNVNGRKVHLARTGRVWGDVNASALTMDEGSFLDGKITMIGHPAGTQGFGALPAPEVAVLKPMIDDDQDSDLVEVELVDDDEHSADARMDH